MDTNVDFFSICQNSTINTDYAINNALRNISLKPTAQRRSIIKFIFSNGHKHFTIDSLILNVQKTVSRATVYNTVNTLLKFNLLQEINIDNIRFFDTNLSSHCHLYNAKNTSLTDAQHDQNMTIKLLKSQLANENSISENNISYINLIAYVDEQNSS